jgi:hypothetical protein
MQLGSSNELRFQSIGSLEYPVVSFSEVDVDVDVDVDTRLTCVCILTPSR